MNQNEYLIISIEAPNLPYIHQPEIITFRAVLLQIFAVQVFVPLQNIYQR
ncbi:Uncharacterized protein dnm_004930 [Desulfonema magnum]|uniref:Uncharacterized protein n=1 Tax=Desulfonema magnum TaxID=45655 RepID=A0A975BFJ1_9BACT|nr:Uncharacterized protein dnm_004930 [Desulfonema magnum]